jgi:hypothetical protein
MKYPDNHKHLKKSDDHQPSKREKNRLEKRSIESFKKKVPDKFWFESLTHDVKLLILNDYQHSKIFNSFGFGKFNLEEFWIINKNKYPGDKSLIRELKLKSIIN